MADTRKTAAKANKIIILIAKKGFTGGEHKPLIMYRRKAATIPFLFGELLVQMPIKPAISIIIGTIQEIMVNMLIN